MDAVAGALAKKNHWSVDGRGNYWDDYQGYDADGDGVGDIPYRYTSPPTTRLSTGTKP